MDTEPIIATSDKGKNDLTYPTPAEIRGSEGSAVIRRVERLLDEGEKPSLAIVKSLLSKTASDSADIWHDEAIPVTKDNDSFEDMSEIAFKAMEALDSPNQLLAFDWFLNLSGEFEAGRMMATVGVQMTIFLEKSPVKKELCYKLLNFLYDKKDTLVYDIHKFSDKPLDWMAFSVGEFNPGLLVSGLEYEPDEQKALRLFGFTTSLTHSQTSLLQELRNTLQEPNLDAQAKARLERIGKTILGFSPNDQKPFHLCLESVYQKLDFENYRINKELQEQELRRVEDLIKEIPIDGKVLDLACGTGRIALGLADNGVTEVVGIDISPTNIAKAKDKDPQGKVEFREGDWKSIPLPDKSVKLILLLGRSFHHLRGREELGLFLDEAARLLPPGGELLLDMADPNIGAYLENRQKTLETANRLAALGRDPKKSLLKLEDIDWVVDSPDGINYYDRWTPNLSVIKEKDVFRNFEFSFYDFTEIPDGKGSQNVYIRAKRLDDSAFVEELDAFRRSRRAT